MCERNMINNFIKNTRVFDKFFFNLILSKTKPLINRNVFYYIILLIYCSTFSKMLPLLEMLCEY